MNISEYPVFVPLEKEHQNIFDGVFRDCPPLISEFSFTNLYAWRNVYKLQVSSLGGFLILRSDETGRPRFFNPIGRGEPKPAILRILEDSRGMCIRVPQETANLFSQDARFTVTEDRDNEDYLYRAQDLITLSGRKYDAKRNFIRKFKAAFMYEYTAMDSGNIKQVLDFEDRWCVVKDCDDIKGLHDERCAITEIIGNFGLFTDLIAGVIKVRGEICAVAIGEPLNPDTLVMHVLKADPEMAGLYQVMNNEFLKREAGDFAYINLEQDLGVEGLRKAKLSYQPIRMVKKFTIT